MLDHFSPKVSVLVPAFNEEKYIEHTLVALLLQDYSNFEIIVVDNASTDGTSAIVERLIEGQPGICGRLKLVHESRKGTNFAREKARQEAKGSIIAQIDADCIPTKNWIRKGVTELCACRKKRVAVTGPYDYYDGQPWVRHFSLLCQRLIYPVVSTMVQLAGKAAILIGGNTFIRADFLELVGGYNTALTFYGDDIDMGKRLARHGVISYVPGLTMLTSSRRYHANGFWEVNKRYQACFWQLVWQNEILVPTTETSHPR